MAYFLSSASVFKHRSTRIQHLFKVFFEVFMATQFEHTIDGKVFRSLDEYKEDMLLDYCNKDVALAVCMASIPRLGKNSPLFQLDANVLDLVAKTCSLGPGVPTDIKSVFQKWEKLHAGEASRWQKEANLERQKDFQQAMMVKCVHLQRDLTITIKILETYSPEACKEWHQILMKKVLCYKCNSFENYRFRTDYQTFFKKLGVRNFSKECCSCGATVVV